MSQFKEAYAGNAAPPQSVPPQKRAGTMPVPGSWRVGQIVLTALLVLFALYFNLKGWRSGLPEDTRPVLFDQIGFFILGAFIWLSTPPAFVIARTTWHEALRRRWMQGLLALGSILLIFMTMGRSNAIAGEELRSFQDFGTTFIIAITLLISIFLGVSLVSPEIERRTIFTILSKPVNRMEFLLGKFYGLCLTLLMSLLILGGVFLLFYALFQFRRYGVADAFKVIPNERAGLGFDLMNMGAALALHYGQLMVMAALALTMSLVVSNITAVVFCFIAYFGGQMSSYWGHLGKSHGATDESAGLSGPAQQAIKIIYLMLPRLDKFDVRNKLVTDAPVTLNYVWRAWDSGLIYVAALLGIAYLVFSDREF